MPPLARPRRPATAIAVHVLRVALVVGLLWLIPKSQPVQWADLGQPPEFDLSRVQREGQSLFADAAVTKQAGADGFWPVLDAAGVRQGAVARTLPQGQSAIGYRGPTESALLLDNEFRVVDVQLVHSADTTEHVEAVKRDQKFLKQFRGLRLGEISSSSKIDGVSGATLTSLAMAKGILLRLGGERPSLVFPEPLQESELKGWIKEPFEIDEKQDSAIVRDAEGKTLGRVVRSGTWSESVIGYQGPTEMLVRLDTNDQVVDLRIRKSFDNEPYVGYVRTERSFWKKFKGQRLTDLAAFDREAAGVEGVSGATMTSLAVADTLVDMAKLATAPKVQEVAPEPPSWWSSFRFATADWLTLGILGVGLLASRWTGFRRPLWRNLWLFTVVVLFGLGTGNLVSMALVAGWSAEGIAWQLAPGLFVVAAIAFLVPPTTKGNPYCNHLCPHGAIQQWIKPGPQSSRRLKVPPKVTRALTWTPGITLASAYVCLVLLPATDLSRWEPFHAYLFQLAGWSSLAIAGISLLVSAFIPMGYCRMGCPTGRLLEYLRRSASSDRLQIADGVAVALLAMALLVHLT